MPKEKKTPADVMPLDARIIKIRREYYFMFIPLKKDY